METLTKPLTRYVGFFIAILSVVIIDNGFGKLLLDLASIYPFMTMMIVPASLALKNKQTARSAAPKG